MSLAGTGHEKDQRHDDGDGDGCRDERRHDPLQEQVPEIGPEAGPHAFERGANRRLLAEVHAHRGLRDAGVGIHVHGKVNRQGDDTKEERWQ